MMKMLNLLCHTKSRRKESQVSKKLLYWRNLNKLRNTNSIHKINQYLLNSSIQEIKARVSLRICKIYRMDSYLSNLKILKGQILLMLPHRDAFATTIQRWVWQEATVELQLSRKWRFSKNQRFLDKVHQMKWLPLIQIISERIGI